MIDRSRPPASFVATVKMLGRSLQSAGKSREEVESEQRAYAEKCGMAYDVEWSPFAGATSFAEYDSYQTAQAQESATYELMYAYEGIVQNILADDEMPLAEKATRIAQASQDLSKRVGMPPPPDSDMDDAEEAAEQVGGMRSFVRKVFGKRATKAEAKDLPEGGTFRAFKAADGTMRWLAIYSNNFEDLEGEIFPYESHAEFVEWADKTKDYPELWLWHTPGTRIGEADAIDLSTEGFMVALGHFDDGMEHAARALEAAGPQSVSHGYEYREAGLVNGIYTKAAHYRTFEISAIPPGREANPHGTGFAAGMEVSAMLTKEKRDYMLPILGADVLDRLDKSLGEAATAARAKGIAFKDLDLGSAVEEAPPAPPPPPAGDQGDPPDLTQQLTAALAPILAPITEQLNALAGRVEEQGKSLNALHESDDAKIAARMGARAAVAPFVPTSAPQNEAGKDDKAAEQFRQEAGKTGADIVDGAPDFLKEHLSMLVTPRR